jgi:hypothetical protein
MSDLDDVDWDTFNTRLENLKQLLSPIRDALNEMGIPDYSEYKGSPSYFQRQWAISDSDDLTNPQIDVDLGGNCVAYKLDRVIDIVLMIQLSGSVGYVTWIELSLVEIAKSLFATAHFELESLEQRQKLNLESEQNLDDVIEDRVVKVISHMVTALPRLIMQAINRALLDGIQVYEKFDLERNLKLHWRNLQVSRNEVQTNTELKQYLDDMDQSIEEERKQSKHVDREAADKKLSILPKVYKRYCLHYKKAKQDYKREKTRYWKRFGQAKMEDWREEWSQQSRNYPNLDVRCVNHISSEEEIMPRELAYLHLGFVWDVGPDQMKRIIKRELKRQKETSLNPRSRTTD